MRQSLLLFVLGAFLFGAPLGAQSADPKEMGTESWISVSGTIVSTTPSTFKLDYGG